MPIINRLRISWSLWKYGAPTAASVAIAAICYAVGWLFSTPCDGMPFSRSGAAATFFAIGFAVYDFKLGLAESETKAKAIIDRATEGFPLTGASSRKISHKKIENNTSRATMAISWVQVSLLMLATLIWGFGDLIAMKINYHCPAMDNCSFTESKV